MQRLDNSLQLFQRAVLLKCVGHRLYSMVANLIESKTESASMSLSRHKTIHHRRNTTYFNLVREVFALSALATSIAPASPISLYPRLHRSLLEGGRSIRPWRIILYLSSVKDWFLAKANAKSFTPLSLRLFFHRLETSHDLIDIGTDNTVRAK